jgi:hypothetical protein
MAEDDFAFTTKFCLFICEVKVTAELQGVGAQDGSFSEGGRGRVEYVHTCGARDRLQRGRQDVRTNGSLGDVQVCDCISFLGGDNRFISRAGLRGT